MVVLPWYGLLVYWRLDMKEKIERIKSLLDDIEREGDRSPEATALRVFSGLELPDIIRDIVDLLMPNLKPYEAAFYLHLFRHSILETGNPYIRVSRRGLQSGVVKSNYADGASGGKNPGDITASFKTVRMTLEGLEAVGALRKEGEPNRDGTLYRIMLPEEIDVCKRARAARTAIEPPRPASESEADYYNVRENRLKVFERDNYCCQYCGKQLTRFTATLDHVKAVSEGGDNSFANLTTACLQCNSKKNARLLGDFMVKMNPSE